MSTLRLWIAAGGAALALGAQAQQNVPHIGYVYPAGGKAGSTFEVVVGGQFLAGVTNVFFSGGGITAAIRDFVRPIQGKELNEARIKIDELTIKRAVARNDTRTLSNFQSFQNSKNIKVDKDAEAKEIERLKQKYAGATWTAEDEKMLAELRRKLALGVRRPENPAISEIVTMQVTIAADAWQGDREVRLGAGQGLTNPMRFKVGQLPEVTKPAVKTIKAQTTVKEKQMSVPQFKLAKERDETKLTIPAVVNGQILPGTVDYFRFAATKGTKLVIAASARELIPYIADAVPGWFQATLALYDANNKELAYEDDFRFNPDPALYYTIPADGEYVLAIQDSIYRGREDFVYRITLGEIPFITSIAPLGGPVGAATTVELKGWNLPTTSVTVDNTKRARGVYPIFVRKDHWISNYVPFAVDDLPELTEQKANSQHRTAQQIKLPVTINGVIDKPADRDYFKFEGVAGQQIVAEVMAHRLNSPLDSLIKITDAEGKQVAVCDDFEDKAAGLETHHADAYLRYTLPANGTYFVEVTDTAHRGGPEYAYRMRVSAPRPDFALRVVPPSINVRSGSTVPVTVYAVRRDGFTNAISLALKDAPEGFRLSGNTIPAGQDSVKLTLAAQAAPAKGPVHLNITGRAAIGGADVVRTAVPAEDMMQAFFYRHLVPSKELDVAMLGGSRFTGKNYGGGGSKGPQKKLPDVKIVSKLPAKIPAGGTTALQLNIPGYIATSGRVEMELTDPPEGITIKKFVPGKNGAEIILAADGEKAKAGQKGNLIVAVMAKPKDKTITQKFQVQTLPAIPFEVMPPR